MADPVIVLDKSKYFSENRGDMTPEDPLYRVRWWQGGTMVYQGKRVSVTLPFDAAGNLVPDDGPQTAFKGKDTEGKDVTYQPLYSPLMKAYLDAKKKKVAQVTAAVAASEPVIDEGENEGDVDVLGAGSAEDEVNLQAWLRGQIEYPPHLVRSAYRNRYNRAQTKISDLVVDLVLDEKLIPEDELAPKFKGYLPQAAAA